jgi:hypothetical protein
LTRAWFVDALDARGGLAFASHRQPDLQGDMENVNAPAVHLSAPSFAPEPVASRATGLAAVRAGFQLGLFVDGVEVAFEELDDLVEFVRRAYGASGGADGSNDPGRVPPPSPPPDGGADGRADGALQDRGRHEREAPKGSAAVTKMLAMIDQASGRAGKKTAGMKRETGSSAMLLAHTEPVDLAVGGPDGTEAIDWAAVALGCELVRRLPRSREDVLRWLDAMSSLCQAAWNLNLSGKIHDFSDLVNAGRHVLDDRLELLFSKAVVRHVDGRLDDELAASVAASIMACEFGHPRFVRDLHRSAPVLVWWGRSAYDAWHSPHVSAASERFSALSRWPLPSPTATRLGLDPAASTLADLLCVMTAAPLAASGDPLDAGMLLLAAAHVAGDPGRSWLGHSPGTVRAALRERQVRQAQEWLVRQFPSRVFDPEIEALIGQARALRYA